MAGNLNHAKPKGSQSRSNSHGSYFSRASLTGTVDLSKSETCNPFSPRGACGNLSLLIENLTSPSSHLLNFWCLLEIKLDLKPEDNGLMIQCWEVRLQGQRIGWEMVRLDLSTRREIQYTYLILKDCFWLDCQATPCCCPCLKEEMNKVKDL